MGEGGGRAVGATWGLGRGRSECGGGWVKRLEKGLGEHHAARAELLHPTDDPQGSPEAGCLDKGGLQAVGFIALLVSLLDATDRVPSGFRLLLHS